MTFFGKIVPYLVYLGQGEDFEVTTELSRKLVQYLSTTRQYKTA